MKIAIVGSGIAGLTAAYRLHPRHQITLFEAAPRLGGHSNTVTVDLPEGKIPVDTGFIVFNDWTYPNFYFTDEGDRNRGSTYRNEFQRKRRAKRF